MRKHENLCRGCPHNVRQAEQIGGLAVVVLHHKVAPCKGVVLLPGRRPSLQKAVLEPEARRGQRRGGVEEDGAGEKGKMCHHARLVAPGIGLASQDGAQRRLCASTQGKEQEGVGESADQTLERRETGGVVCVLSPHQVRSGQGTSVRGSN